MQIRRWSLASFLIGCLTYAVAAPRAFTQAIIPSGTPIEIRLTRRISTRHSAIGSPVHAILAAPVMLGDTVVLPLGSKVEGAITHRTSVRLGLVHESSSIGFEIKQVILPDGTPVPIAAKVAQIENSREAVTSDGRIKGVRATSTLAHRTSGLVGTLALSNPLALIFTTASSASLLRFSDPEISLPANAELILLTTAPISVQLPAAAPPIPPVASQSAQQIQLTSLIHKESFRTVTAPKRIPSDITNLMFLGEGSDILHAFHAAGWTQVDSLDATTTYRTIRSIAEQQAYRTAPMSTLLLNGTPPAFALAKTLDTFSKRHHLRIFTTPHTWQGHRVWLSSSTQDIGIGLSESRRNFIHQIDHNIDHERTKVVNDLLLTGCVNALNLVSRPWLPTHLRNGTGEEIITDKRMAVLSIGPCHAPENVASSEETAPYPASDNAFVKGTRQTTLTLRDMLVRDNVAVTAYTGIKTVLGVKHPKPPEAPLSTSSIVNSSAYVIGADHDPSDPSATPAAISSETQAARSPDAPRFPPYAVELGIHGGFAGYAGGNGAAVGYLFVPDDLATQKPILLALGNDHANGWNLGGSVTLNTHAHFAHQISFDYNRTNFSLKFADLDLSSGPDTTDPATQSQFTLDTVSLSTTEVAYNLQYLPASPSSRLRPYLSAGPSLRLMHLTDAPITKASPWFKLGLGTVGAITAAYQFGSAPPLEGGGIFQPGFQYGAGIKFRASRRFLLRAEYKETLSAQPDFWSKSKDDIFDPTELPGYSLYVIGPEKDGLMRQQRATAGVSFVF